MHSGFNNPFFDIVGFSAEVYTDFKEFPSVHFERKGVMLVVDLPQSLFGRTVQFKFHYIGELISLQDKVDAPVTRFIFYVDVEADQFENNEKHVFVMQLLVTDHFVGSISKETLQAAEERVIITRFHFTDKLLNFKRDSTLFTFA